MLIGHRALFNLSGFEIAKMNDDVRQRVVVGRQRQAIDDARRSLLSRSDFRLHRPALYGLRQVLCRPRGLLSGDAGGTSQKRSKHDEFQAKSHDVILLLRIPPISNRCPIPGHAVPES